MEPKRSLKQPEWSQKGARSDQHGAKEPPKTPLAEQGRKTEAKGTKTKQLGKGGDQRSLFGVLFDQIR